LSDKPKEEILVPPEWSILVFGDGYIALMKGAIEKEDSEGNIVVEATIEPHELLRKRYNIKENELDNNGNIQSYQMMKEDLIPMNLFDDANRKWLYIKNYLHQETNISNISWDLRKQFVEERKKRIILEGHNIFLSEQLSISKQNPAEFLSQGLEFFQKINNGILETIRTKKEKEE
jgi:hypothetical protein